MAAQYFSCTQCHKKYPTLQKLFDTLYDFQKSVPEACPACGGARDLRVTLDFQLGTGDGDFKVVSSLLPNKLESWLGEREEEVTLYPFLVVLQRADGKQFCWMPYWHVTGKEARYGQHPVCLEHTQFENLTAQAQGKADEKALEPV